MEYIVVDRISIAIIGAGPTGLGAAWHLEQLNVEDWCLLEAADKAGGLASSFVDERGFTWDIGGHVQFSHYEYFDRAMDEFLGRDGWLEHERESWVWMRDRFVPYPFQNNIHRLPAEDLNRCLDGLVDITRQPAQRPANFRDWILANFGHGIADIFLLPYNYKVWAYPPEMMNAVWVGERVATTDLKRVLRNLVFGTDDLAWGPNNKFRFPKCGGTGAIWQACAERLPQDRIHYKSTVVAIDLEERVVTTDQGDEFRYETLISTIPLRELIRLSGQAQLLSIADRGLLHSASNIFGIGLRGAPPEHLRTKCWMYFPEGNCPFYRVTVFSNYSPENVPDISKYWSLMAEVSESPCKPVDQSRLLREVIDGLVATRLIERQEDIVSTWQYRAAYGYPTPGLERDAGLAQIVPFFEQYNVFPRGRFGLWKYEVSNQDHSFMQGVEVVERLVNGRQEITASNPGLANSVKHQWPFEAWEKDHNK
ncbi:MAG: FAD-dependent oxidoreductase [Caldilineaceae bacterium]|nr:FAD-dependent oxidoreductase [Caldilineaceae bacterium]